MPATTNATTVAQRLSKMVRAADRATDRYLPQAIDRSASAGVAIIRNNTPRDEDHLLADNLTLRDSTTVRVLHQPSRGAAVFLQTRGVAMKGEPPEAHGYPLWKLLHFGRKGGYDVYPLRRSHLLWLDHGKWHFANHTRPGPIAPMDYLRKSRREITAFGRLQAIELGHAIAAAIVRAAA